MGQIFTIITQDLAVAEKAIEAGDFNLVSFIGNRIMMNLLVTDDIQLMLIGYMVRELGGELRHLKENRNSDIINIKRESITYIKDLEAQIASGNTDPKIYWEKFYEIETKLRKRLLSDNENTIYDEQSEFAKDFGIILMDNYYTRKNDVLVFRNLTAMTSIELGRNFNNHGGKEALVIYLVFKALYDYTNYLNNELELLGNKKRVKGLGARLLEYIENIYRMKSSISNIDELYERSNIIIDDLGRDTKRLYLSCGGMREKAVERELELPEDAKQKIGETIMQSLQNKKEVEG